MRTIPGVCVEICIDSYDSLVSLAGFHHLHSNQFRVEVCSNLINGGGLTPSMGLVELVTSALPGRAMIMIRPRTGSFVYTDGEILSMCCDIDNFKRSYGKKILGFVFGCLDREGNVDLKNLKILADRCEGYQVTFHRAFDLTPNWKQALDTILKVPQITRILTSGHSKTITSPSGLSNLSEMISHIQKLQENPFHTHRLIILPGSGISSRTVPLLRESCPELQEIHLSASSALSDDYTDEKVGDDSLGFGFGENKVWMVNKDELDKVVGIVNTWSEEDYLAGQDESLDSETNEEMVLRRGREEDERKERAGLWAAKRQEVGELSAPASREGLGASLRVGGEHISSDIDLEEVLRMDEVARRERRERSGSTVVTRGTVTMESEEISALRSTGGQTTVGAKANRKRRGNASRSGQQDTRDDVEVSDGEKVIKRKRRRVTK